MLNKHLKSIIYKDLTVVLIITLLSVFTFILYRKLNTSGYLSFSDSAKYADIARNLSDYGIFGSSFAFPGSNPANLGLLDYFSNTAVPPLVPFLLAAIFKIFGANDVSVIMLSFVEYILLIVAVYLLAKKLHISRLVAILSAVAIVLNIDVLNYATTGASEITFMLLIVLVPCFLLIKKKSTDLIAFLLLILMYFTRPQAFIYIAGFILFWLLLNFKPKVATKYFVGTLIVGFLVDRFVLLPLSGKYFLYAIMGRGLNAITQYLPGAASSDILRGGVQNTNILAIGKKIFYNLYNFYKLLPSIASPYMWGLFVICLFRWKKDKVYNAFKASTIFTVIATFLVAALTIPLYRYIHPIIPLVYILAIDTLIWIVNVVVSGWLLVVSGKLKTQITNHKLLVTAFVSTFLVFVFVVGQTLGVIFLDSRFEAKRVNKDKPPVYVILSKDLKEITKPNQIILTNLDTWGSWYGERKTVWYPLTPNMIIPKDGQSNPFDAIYLTSYLIDDENYYMGSEWRQMFNDPENINNKYIRDNYKLAKIINIDASETYEKQPARAVLLVKK